MNILSVIWALLNIALVIVLLSFWLRSFSLIAAKYGRLGTVAGFIFTFSMCIRPTGGNALLNQSSIRTPLDPASVAALRASNVHTTVLLDLPLTTIEGYWSLGHQPADSSVLTFRAVQTGLMGYLRWEPQAGPIYLTPDRHLHYESSGILVWYLLGIPLYRQYHHFSGDVPLQSETHRPGV